MKKGCLIGGTFIVLAIILLGIIGWGIKTNNQVIDLDTDVNLKWSHVESAYQRRADLIPNLIATVEKATSHEKETLTAVIEARAKATSIQIDPSNLTPDKLAEFQQAQDGLQSSLSRLLVSVERYPELKANESILAFQNQLEGTENRIKIERDNFNQSIAGYNSFILKFPASLVASFKNYKAKDSFKSKPGAENAPKVEFGK